jgi:hypothetical protein
MIQSQKNNLPSQWQPTGQGRNLLLQRHPLLAPLALFMSAITLAISSIFADSLFPILTFFSIPSALICCLFAVVLGLCAILVSITGLLEHLDTHQFRQASLALTPYPKGPQHDYN